MSISLDLLNYDFRTAIDESDSWRSFTKTDLGMFYIPASRHTPTMSSRLRYINSVSFLHSFRVPFQGETLLSTHCWDEVAYLNCALRVNQLSNMKPDAGVYIELSVESISDHLSLSLVDFDGAGTSSLTFSPDCGAVIQETKSYDEQLVHGQYSAVLGVCRGFGKKTESRMAVFISSTGDVTFMRRAHDQWESTGVISNLTWVIGGILTPCVAFRRQGAYNVRIRAVGVRERPGHVTVNNPVLAWKPLLWLLEGRDDRDADEEDDN